MQRQSEGLMYMHSHTPTNFARVLCVLVTRGASGGRSCIVGACMRVCALLQLQAPTADLVQRDTNDSTGTWAGGEGSEGSLPAVQVRGAHRRRIKQYSGLAPHGWQCGWWGKDFT
mmetsp:Transcript_101200/g.171236  ORF Transcript_101200/g.171236 Transcript_101200/m.171236 type:complete len:115 (+) Transcript_101200:3623-3967(+)